MNNYLEGIIVSGIAGIVCNKRRIDNELENVENMIKVMNHRGGKKSGVKIFNHCVSPQHSL